MSHPEALFVITGSTRLHDGAEHHESRQTAFRMVSQVFPRVDWFLSRSGPAMPIDSGVVAP